MYKLLRPSSVVAYAIAVLLVALVAAIRVILDPFLGDPGEFALFYLVVAFSAYIGGFGPGLMATGCAAIVVAYYFMSPPDSLALSTLDDWLRQGAFLLGGVAISAICESLLRSRDEAQRVAAALLTQRQLSHITLASIGDAVITTNDRAVVTFLNPVAESLTGFSSAEAEGQPIDRVFRIVNEDTNEVVESPVIKVLREGTIVGLANHTILLSKDGRSAPIDDSGAPIRDDQGRTLGVVLVFRDISERKRAEQEHREIEERFRIMADAAPVMIWMARTDKGCDWCNKLWLDFVGRSMEEERGLGWAEHIYPDDRARCLKIYFDAFDARRSFAMDFRMRRRDGEYRWIFDQGAPRFAPSGEFTGYIGSCMDITDRKTAETERDALYARERAARSEAEQANRTKDEFLATLSHELRTPLNAILGWAQILRAGAADPKSLARGLEVIERNARVQTQIIEDLLDMSRIISGKSRLDVRAVELPSVIDAAMEAMRPAAQAKSTHVTRTITTEAERVHGDPARLQQVIWNLLSNAIKFSPPGSSVTIDAKLVDRWVEIAVTDTGEGIAPEFLPYVFDRFRQADSSVTRRHGGLGLGLAIVRNLVELHGGSVRAMSEGEGRGSTFVVRLPAEGSPANAARDRADAKEAPPPSPRAAARYTPPSLDGVNVLLVDDDPDARDLGTHVLSSRGANVTTAASAAEGFATIQRLRPDVLLCDIGMPDEDGYELLRRIRALGAGGGGALPAVALTAFARPDDRRRAMLAGFQVHLPKPVDPVELAAVVASLAGRHP